MTREEAAIKSCEDRIKHLENAPVHYYGKRRRKRAIELERVKIDALTPPSNEPLTLEQLREMDGQPVFLVFMQPIEYGWEDQWALVDSENETVFNGAYKFDFSNCVGFAYRRPPEGEEDI